MNPFLAVSFLILNAGSIAAFLWYRREVVRLCAQVKADSKANLDTRAAQTQQIIDRVNFVHECTLLLGRNQNEAIIPRVEAIRGELSVHSGAIRADIAALGKQFGDFAYGARILNARVKKEEAAAAVQEAERTRIAAHRLAQATPAAPVTAEVLMARRKASGLIAPRELNLPQDQMGVKE